MSSPGSIGREGIEHLARPDDDPGVAPEARYRKVRLATEQLAGLLSPEDCALQSMPDASPVKWHFAHTSWFFETFVLEPSLRAYRRFHPDFLVLFNSYYNSVGAQHPRPERGLLSRPSLDEVLAYRGHVDAHMAKILRRRDGLARSVAERVELGIQHEQQHQELILTDVKHLFAGNPLRPSYRDRPFSPPTDPAPLRWRTYPAGIRWIGHDGRGFSFDNERPRHQFLIEAFDLASRPVTNDEFLAFIEDGAYQRAELWLSDGWDAVRARDWDAPLYWERRDGTWRVMTLAGLRDLDPEEPVCHISFYEADAFARWAEARLPTEEEWEIAAGGAPVDGNFVETGRLQPAPGPAMTETSRPPLPSAGARAAGCANPGEASSAKATPDLPVQLFGDVWEWTRSPYNAYPGYQPPEGPLGEYNGKFMCNQMVLRGGSCVTPRSHIRPTYRNFFPPATRWQFSGIRLARDARP